MKKNINKVKVTKYRTAPILSYVSEKKTTRRKLADEFISISPSFCFRSVASLKKFYKKELCTTGGEPPPILEKYVDDYGIEHSDGKVTIWVIKFVR